MFQIQKQPCFQRFICNSSLQTNPNGPKKKAKNQSNHNTCLLQIQRVPEGLSFQTSRQMAHESGKVISPMHRLPLPPRKYTCYSFLLEVELTAGPQCGRHDYVNEKVQRHNRESNQRPAGFVAQCVNQLPATACPERQGTNQMIWKNTAQNLSTDEALKSFFHNTLRTHCLRQTYVSYTNMHCCKYPQLVNP